MAISAAAKQILKPMAWRVQGGKFMRRHDHAAHSAQKTIAGA
jgi:hypothetical protein